MEPSVSARFWAGFFKETCCGQVQRFCSTIEARVLPTLSNIEAEAEVVAKEAYDNWPGYSEDPEAGVAEADVLAQDYYDSMKGVEQAFLNLGAVALFHLVEQHLLFYLRRQILIPLEENNSKLFNLEILGERLRPSGVDMESLRSSSVLNELRLVANTVKHAEGPSSKELWQLRSDLFEHPALAAFGESAKLGPIKLPVFAPLAGEDFFITPAELKRYGERLIQFLNEFADALLKADAKVST